MRSPSPHHVGERRQRAARALRACGGASVRSAARSFAERARGLAGDLVARRRTSGRLVSTLKLGAAWRDFRLMPRAAAAVRAIGEERLDDAVFQRMERHDDEPAAGLEHALGGEQRLLQFVELFVDEDAQRLERARRRMDFARTLAHHARDDLGERPRRRDRRVLARLDDGARDRAARMRSSPRTAMMRARSAGDARATTSAALGPSLPIRMSSGPSRRNEKPRSAWSSCIEETPISITTPSTASWPCARADLGEIGEAVLDQHQPAVGADRPDRNPRRSPMRSRSMPITCVAGDVENGAAVAAGAEGRVDIDAAGARREPFDRLAAKHGDVPGRWSCRSPGGAPVTFAGTWTATGPWRPDFCAWPALLRGERSAAWPRREVRGRPRTADLSTELAGLPWHLRRQRLLPPPRFGCSPLSNDL